ncbi:MAG: hypothetical protein AAB914_02285 [Patescibacteria group bacterium]|mgnify:CR=1 FL=1
MNSPELLTRGYSTLKEHAFELAAVGTAVVALAGAKAQNANAETFRPPETVANPCPLFPTEPCDMGIDPNSLDNMNVAFCQADAMGVEGDKYMPGIVTERSVEYSIGSNKVKVGETLSKLENGSILEYDSSCASVTKNYVKQRMVAARPGKKDPSKVVYKGLTGSKTVMGSKDTTFQESRFPVGNPKEIKSTTTFKLRKKLTPEDVRGGKVCLEDTFVSEPLVQRPHFELDRGPAYSFPGPMTTQSRKVATCIKWSQVKNARSYKKKKK